MEKTAQDILLAARDLFMRFGIKSISMDDIAREQGISKKTIYKYFDSKKELVSEVAMAHNRSEKMAIEEIRSQSTNAVHEMIMISRYVNGVLRELKPSVVYDLQKYYRHSWKLFESLHNDFVYKVMKENLEQGQKEGSYRENVDTDIIARFYTGMTLMMTDEDLFPVKQYSKEKIYQHYIDYHLTAILTPKGRTLYQKYSNQ